MALHSSLTGAELHEPKGADAAAANRVYVSDGAGGGSWTTLPAASISGLNNSNRIYIQARIPDISTADVVYVPCPLAGDIISVISVLDAAIVTDNGDVRLRIGGTPVTDSNITITASGSAAGDVDTATPTAANTVTANSAIEVQTLGNASTAVAVEIMIVVDVS